MVEQILPLSVQGVSVKKRGKTIISELDLELSKDGLTIIMGPNGAGKTTLLRLLHGLEQPRTGKLDWNTNLKTARLNQAFVFQTPIMLRRSALENIIYPLTLKGASKSEAMREAEKWINIINLEQSAHLNAKLLSGGEKQKLALARALATKPQLLLLDEPTSNLDGRATKEIEALLNQTRKSGTRIVMTTHDIGQAKRLADEVIFLYHGKIHEKQEAISFFKKPSTKEATAFLKGDIVE